MKHTFSKKFMLIILFIFLMPIFALANIQVNDEPIYRQQPKYLLTGDESASDFMTSDNDFIYYKLTSKTGELTNYAIGLTITGKTKTSITIPATYNSNPIVGIWRSGFMGAKCTTVTFGMQGNSYNITTIDYEAFMGCAVTNLTIPYTVSQIGEAAFYTSKIQSIKFSNSSKAETTDTCIIEDEEEYEYSNLNTIPNFCFLGCTALTSVTLPNKIEEIGYEAFNGCRALSSTFCFTSSFKYLRSRAFQGCTSLTQVYFPPTFFNSPYTNTIEPHAFNFINKKNLKIYFSGTSDGDGSNINNWIAKHSNWGLYKEDNTKLSYTLNEGNPGLESDWFYNIYSEEENGVNVNKAKILSYVGPNVKQLSIPSELGGDSHVKVTLLDDKALDSVKESLVCIYLPSTLERINNNFFSGSYKNLLVVDVNVDGGCNGDKNIISSFTSGNELNYYKSNLDCRINLSEITGLKYIGSKSFTDLPNIKYIRRLHLPYSLIAIGDQAFGTSNNSGKCLTNVFDFQWAFDEEKSCLKSIGNDCFYKMGIRCSGDNYSKDGSELKDQFYTNSFDTSGNRTFTPTTLVFPATFAGFGISNSQNTKYGFANPSDTSSHFFGGCPLIGKVIFKGNSQSPNLTLGIQTFVFNESLRTIIFEDRPGKYINFHCQNGNWGEPCIGSNAGRFDNDFYGEPFLQTIVLPNATTKLRFQNCSLQGNSRCAMYLTGEYGQNMVGCTGDKIKDFLDGSTQEDKTINQLTLWNSIGDESYYNGNTKGFFGYCFSSNRTSNASNVYNGASGFGIDQRIPYYENVHYKETITGDSSINGGGDLIVEVGDSALANNLVISDKCAFVCNNDHQTAILSNYLYDRYSAFDGTAIIPPSVQNNGTIIPGSGTGTTCYVKEIGDSAFSACFSETNQNSYSTAHNNSFPAANKDLSKVYIPDSIERIGDYAFMRAYGVNEISSYTNYNGGSPTVEQYVMPSNLAHIGKHAFAFCSVAQIKKIPYTCTFDENEHETTYQTSAFSNNLALRKITFLNGASESTSSQYYQTTTYQTSQSKTYTSAIYSNDNVAYNKNSLLMILNRDVADFVSYNNTDYKSDHKFYGDYKTGEALYGAYKMGYFIKTIVLGSYKTSSGNILPQALFSGVGKRSSKNTAIVQSYVHLYEVTTNYYTSNSCDLTTISFSTEATSMDLPDYTFDGCENVDTIEIPQCTESSAKKIPDGVFKNITKTPLKFKTPAKEAEGVLDLSTTGYIGIGEETFNNVIGVTTFIAPGLTNTPLTIEANAFASSGITTVDFSHVQTQIIINESAFANSNVKNIIWPTHNNVITIGANAFKNCPMTSLTLGDCTYSLGDSAFLGCNKITEITLTPGVTSIGTNCFKDCTSLESVTATNNLVSLNSLGDTCFHNCTSLTNFDFSYFTALTAISNGAFKSDSSAAGMTICNDGDFVLPNNIETVGENAFSNSGIQTLTIDHTAVLNSSSFSYCAYLTNICITSPFITLKNSCFSYCNSLQYITIESSRSSLEWGTMNNNPELLSVIFTNENCTWETTWSTGHFNSCPKLATVVLPRGFDINTTAENLNDSFVSGNSNTPILTYYKFKEQNDVQNKKWLEYGKDQYATLYYYVTTKADCLTKDQTQLLNTTTSYWMKDGSGKIIKLGKCVSYSGGVITFESGHTLST